MNDNAMIRTTRRFLRDERAATAVEYSLIAAGVAGAIVAVVGTLGGNVKAMWTTIKNAMGS